MRPVTDDARQILQALGAPAGTLEQGDIEVHSPISGELVGRVASTGVDKARDLIAQSHDAFLAWRNIPPPQRGELVRLFAEELRSQRELLGRLISIEAGKILSEGIGEVQEMIDICAFACGLSRQLYGLTIASERPQHRMMETWHPLGVVGIVSAFNFPVAVWAWNAALALVCGNAVVWKPSPKTPLCAWAAQRIFARAAAKFDAAMPGLLPPGLSAVIHGGRELAELLADNPRIALLSATGSTAMGRSLGPRVAQRLGRSLLELGGNNAAIVCPSADLDLALRAIAFSALGTAGQRCTTLRRLIVHEGIYDSLITRLKHVYGSVTVGDPRDPGSLVGPLIDGAAFENMQAALAAARASGGQVIGGERVALAPHPDAYYVRPALIEMPLQAPIVQRETFAPILYVLRYSEFRDALALHNGVPQGLSSSIFTRDIREAELFLSAEGSDCGIANINIGPSGAEIGGAFGGEKDTGGGRESGSDAWKAYMRRATNTINYGDALPLAQGVRFDID